MSNLAETFRKRDYEAARTRLLARIAQSDPGSPTAGRLREGLRELEADGRLTVGRKLKNVKRLIKDAAPENVLRCDRELLAGGGG